MLTIQESKFGSLKTIISDKNTSNINHTPLNNLVHSRAIRAQQTNILGSRSLTDWESEEPVHVDFVRETSEKMHCCQLSLFAALFCAEQNTLKTTIKQFKFIQRVYSPSPYVNAIL